MAFPAPGDLAGDCERSEAAMIVIDPRVTETAAIADTTCGEAGPDAYCWPRFGVIVQKD
jgi:anaerobic selenocysteine-containing dehydrogenase